ncbi:MAG: tRNA uridine-5-carboxymethylaminomethyl(34) synthesis enzyme MnmG [Clostridiales bacterium]|nr:tRNA uridine-5-carboxymethylaminomethyl(34) synthesis enzyme MnmG [Clostridiales bacterium]
MKFKADVAVIGAGHAGVEAALACARLGLDTVIFTINLDSVANLPCNPSIGGAGKGHLVYEIDALGGEMGRVADMATLQSRTLNLGKGAAVHSKRIQADRTLYRILMKSVLEKQENLRLIQAEIVDIRCEEKGGKKQITSVITHLGEVWEVCCAIICAGTYLNSTIFVGQVSYDSGPDGLMPAKGLSSALFREGIKLMRFKTGTPARLKKSTIDLSRLDVQEGEERIAPFSVLTDPVALNSIRQIPCYMLYTSKVSHDLIRKNLHRSAMYSGKIHGTGPRYCPSIEDKIVRFADKERHQLFLEPMGGDTEEMYLQGFSTSMPSEVQHEMLRSLDGFENVQIMRYAYAIEYDCADPTQLYPTLEFKSIAGLYGAGQFNGSSGYEEAAAQGLIAGINAAMRLLGKESVVLERSSSYIGTLIDDLVTKGTNEPYRIMTSRSEYRLLLRQDNADLRLTDIGYRVGLINRKRYDDFCRKREQIEEEIRRMNKTIISPSSKTNYLLRSYGSAEITTGARLADLLRRPELDYEKLTPLDEGRPPISEAAARTAQIMIKYEGYINRQLAEVKRQEKYEKRLIPPEVDYTKIRGLRLEAVQKLSKIRPINIGQASRISGVNPADISVLLIWLAQHAKNND